MKRKLMLTVAVVAFNGAGLAAHADTLQEALVAAYTNNPTLEAQRAALRATDENVSQAVSGWRPTVSAGGSIARQNTSQTSTFIPNFPSTTDATFTPRQGQITITQPLFNGFQTINGTKQAKSAVSAGRALLLNTEQAVLLDTVTAYMDVKRDEAVLDLSKNNVQVLERELEAAQDRFRVGEITRTDVAQAKARLSRAISDRVAAEANLQASRASYTKIVGDMPGTLETPPPLPVLPAGEDEALTVALNQNPQLLAAHANERAAQYAVKGEEGGLLPTVQLKGQYSKAYDTSSFTSRADEKSVSAELSVPLYQAGFQSSRIRQAKQINQQRRLEVLDAERQVREAVKTAWEGLREARGRIVANRDQVRANEIALDGVKQEAGVGARTTLDVLNSEQELLDARVSLVRAQRDQYVAAYRLLVSVGELTVESLALPVDQYYNPEEHYDSVRGQVYGWGVTEKEGWSGKEKPAADKASHPVNWSEKLPDGDLTGKLATPEGVVPGTGNAEMWDGIDQPQSEPQGARSEPEAKPEPK